MSEDHVEDIIKQGQIKRMDIEEFREVGYLQELNRMFLHPLGLALEVVVNDDGTMRLGGIWDSRDDPEGILFSDDPKDTWDREMAGRVRLLQVERMRQRQKLLGFWIQGEDEI